MSKVSASEWRARSHAAEQAGDLNGALEILEEGVAAWPDDAALANSAGNAAMRSRNFDSAIQFFGTAAKLQPRLLEFSLNLAISLSRIARYRDALAVLAPFTKEGFSVARYCSVRALAERGAGNLAEAGAWFEQCLTLDPKHARALHGRARLAMQRGERDAVSRYQQALQVTAGDAELWLGQAQAMAIAGDTAEARKIAELLMQQAPQWLDGLQFLAQLRLAAGEADFTSHYTIAMQRRPQDHNIPAAQCAVLAGLDFNREAAEFARSAREKFPHLERFALLEAVYASAAGENERAQSVWNTISLKNNDERIHLARHQLRRGETDKAAILLDLVLQEDPTSISAWALISVVWRLAGDPREKWLHEQQGLVAFLPLQDAENVLPPAIAQLHRLHDTSAQPLGQSLRGGTQTAALLFDRTEPEFAALRDAIGATIQDYQKALPQSDATNPRICHPVLRYRDVPWHMAGSWSVRLSGGAGDRHASHIHPLGIVSSALYCESPPDAAADLNGDPQAGWLELGRPPPDLGIDLQPITAFPPRPGHLALFPSTLYHGTRPFTQGRRLTVAFDVRPEKEPS
ncbi:2OG-Fe(II) oxygenase family protein [Allopontixanthobacter confluentis]|uniref:2OG-Fe(II) oxygenase family protein n=1 Tax=Allopontixanthobacter confluentis TaxID=1849021 RepID=UPI002FCDC36F